MVQQRQKEMRRHFCQSEFFCSSFSEQGLLFVGFYAMPAVVAFLIALFVAFMQNRQQKFADKIKVIAKGVGEENIITMSLIFSLCGWIFRCGNSSRRSGKHSEPGTFSILTTLRWQDFS